MIFFGLKMIIFGHFSRFLAFFKISFSSLQHPIYIGFRTFASIDSFIIVTYQWPYPVSNQSKASIQILIVVFWLVEIFESPNTVIFESGAIRLKNVF